MKLVHLDHKYFNVPDEIAEHMIRQTRLIERLEDELARAERELGCNYTPIDCKISGKESKAGTRDMLHNTSTDWGG